MNASGQVSIEALTQISKKDEAAMNKNALKLKSLKLILYENIDDDLDTSLFSSINIRSKKDITLGYTSSLWQSIFECLISSIFSSIKENIRGNRKRQ
jgi:hypothetical protein